ncbi:hypothetical protein [Calderihabitans maritimus]|uniref:Uncharacterized protein n=1 Tax=Calderihabitans maritimus TaxID=1246530 RepID=A0A1Z5HXE1_9FIRM|nr:hypothetical protein [Calderihabitans maritimus]GAW94001.1 hypothetical protein KKC1_31210 [Calderihabitans maritimus]
MFIASFLTFGFLFIIPVLLFYEVLREKNIIKLLITITSLFLIYLVIYVVFNFNYLNSFRIASSIENPEGFRLLSDPIDYFFTRLENIFEILLFLGPFLTILAFWGITILKKKSKDLFIITILGVSSLLAMFLTGAYKTGETARACIFIYPFLMFPIAAYLENRNIGFSEQYQLSWLTFGQAVLMQLFGFYFW